MRYHTSKINSQRHLVFFVSLFIFGIFLIQNLFSGSAFATNHFAINNLNQLGVLSSDELNEFSQNNILFYEPQKCISNFGSLTGNGDFDAIMRAKNAEKYFFAGEGDVPSAQWSDTDQNSMRVLLETYGDLAYQLGRAVGAPYIAILVQMRYEDPQSICGANNFWGNGCPLSRAYKGGASIQGRNLGEGFVQYAETLTNGIHDQALGVADPKQYLEKIGPTWVQGDVNGAGYGDIEYMKASVDALTDFINSNEGQSIVQTFGNYSSSSTSNLISGSDITWIGDSYSVQADNKGLISESEKFKGVDLGSGSKNTASSYIQGNKQVSVGDSSNPSCLDILDNIISQGKLRSYLVLACGTNGSWSENDVARLQETLEGKDTMVIVTTSKTPNSGYDDSNERLRSMAKSNDRIYLADWASVYEDAYFDGDPEKIHPVTDPGYEKWVEVIYDALNYSGANPNYCGPTSDFASYVLKFAWTIDELNNMGTTEWSGTLTPKPGYKEVYDRRVNEGKYVGSLASYGDCGGFVTTLMNESGYEPGYDYGGKISDGACNTACQERWMQENWELIGISGGGFDTSQLRQGDVYISNTHTFVFVGDISGFGSDIASASWDERVPQAGGNSASEAGYRVYRKKD